MDKSVKDKFKIIYFFEDRAHEGFIKPLVERIAEGNGISKDNLKHDILSATGGSRCIKRFIKFLKDYKKIKNHDVDFLVVVNDGNCKGYNEKIKELNNNIKAEHPFYNKVVYAVPDPHIERWYIMDQHALNLTLGLNKSMDLAAYKCEKNYYKQKLDQAVRDSGVSPLLGGFEYGKNIVLQINDIYALGKQNPDFENFIENLKKMFNRKKLNK